MSAGLNRWPEGKDYQRAKELAVQDSGYLGYGGYELAACYERLAILALEELEKMKIRIAEQKGI